MIMIAAGATKRNPVLKRKFFEIKDDLPKHVQDLFDNPPTDRQRTQTEVINNTFEKSKGKWVVNVDKPFFKVAKDRWKCLQNGSLYSLMSLEECL